MAKNWEFVLFSGTNKEVQDKLNKLGHKYAIKVVSIQHIDLEHCFCHLVRIEKDQGYSNKGQSNDIDDF